MKWRNYKIKWCDTCQTITLICPHCGSYSCNAVSGCKICLKETDEFTGEERQKYKREDFKKEDILEDTMKIILESYEKEKSA